MSRIIKNYGNQGDNMTGNGGAGGGMGSKAMATETRFVDARPNCFVNPHEASSRRGQARSTGVANGGRKITGGGGSNDVGGR